MILTKGVIHSFSMGLLRKFNSKIIGIKKVEKCSKNQKTLAIKQKLWYFQIVNWVVIT